MGLKVLKSGVESLGFRGLKLKDKGFGCPSLGFRDVDLGLRGKG